MKTVQMTLDEDLIEQVDRAARKIGTSRSAFARAALRSALARVQELELERRQRAGYKKRPVRRGEFDRWEAQQVWAE
jgi:metal-responsive CopG/Arc/MetJ family transcriptional regulator